MMKKLFIATILCFSFSVTHAGSVESMMIDDTWVKVYVAELWPGEYPMPVIKVVNDSKVKGRKYVLSQTPTLDCELQTGQVYHPWARKLRTEYTSIATVTPLKALIDQTLVVFGYDSDGGYIESTIDIQKDETINYLTYLGEGYCMYEMDGIEFEHGCFGEGSAFEERAPEIGFTAQYFLALCKNGSRVWIEPKDALAAPGVEVGDIAGFGEIVE
jgi:hypothetical protein